MDESDPRVRYTTNFESSAGISSELLIWQVGVIMIALTLGLSAIVLLALCCNDRGKRKIGEKENEGETSIYTEAEISKNIDTEKGAIHRKIGVAHVSDSLMVSEQSIAQKSNKAANGKKTEKNSVKNVKNSTLDGALYLQRNAGLIHKGRHVEPLPPLPTSVFLISLPTPTDNNSIHPISERYI